MHEGADLPLKQNFRAGKMPALPICFPKVFVMKGTVISYIYDIPDTHTPLKDGMPRAYRQHHVPNLHDTEAIAQQVITERGTVPSGSVLDWVR